MLSAAQTKPHLEYIECPPGWHYHPKGFKYDGFIGDGLCHSNFKDSMAKEYVMVLKDPQKKPELKKPELKKEKP